MEHLTQEDPHTGQQAAQQQALQDAQRALQQVAGQAENPGEGAEPGNGARPEGKPLSALYLLNGDDSLKQAKLLERLKLRIEAMGDVTMNYQVLTAKDIQGPQHLHSILNTLPFGALQRLVVIKDVEQLSKPLSEALVEYAKRTSPTTVLAMTATKLASNTRLYKAIAAFDPKSIVDCGQMKRSELPRLIRDLTKGEGLEISAAAANALIDRVGTSTVAINTEVKKLAAVVVADGRKRIDESDVNDNVAWMVEPKHWDLTNALAMRDLALCLRLVGRMKGYAALGLFIQCLMRIREILTAKSLKARGVPIAAGMGKQEWQIREIVRGCDAFSNQELLALIKQAPEIEQKMKTGADADQLLRLWLIDACVRKDVRS